MPNRIDESKTRLDELSEKLQPIADLLGDEPLCIYATGSYGRLEAWEGSDIDLFFLLDGDSPAQQISWLKFVRVASRLIEATEEMGFPPFSKDGRYLEVQNVSVMEQILGSPEDDGLNAFTARMLLLLESRPVYAEDLYERILRRVIDFYFRDLPGHEEDFQPTFLTNDILRFWRTLTLNYEHRRFEVSQLPRDEQDEARAESALKNYKLKSSRLATCFSMILHLAGEELPILPDQVFDLSQMTPRERFEALRGRSEAADASLDAIESSYETFLKRVQKPEADLMPEFKDRARRQELLAEAAAFGNEIFELLVELTERDRLRHLIV